MSDLISRQAAIEALMSLTIYKSKREIVQAADKGENSWIGGVAECIDEIEDLPSAQPEPHDLVSRQAALDAVKKNTFRLTFAEEQNCEGHVAWSAEAVYSDVMEGALLELPSAQPERKRWEADHDRG